MHRWFGREIQLDWKKIKFGFQRDEFEISNKRKECAPFYQASAWSLFIMTFLYSREHNHNQLNFPISYFQINAIDAWWKRQRDTTLEWCKLCSGPINRKLSIIRGWNVHRYGVIESVNSASLKYYFIGLTKLQK